MLEKVFELTVYAALSGFAVVYWAKLMDYLMDYNQYLWRIRYRVAMSAAKRVGQADKLEIALSRANESGADKVNIMADMYGQIAELHYPFKLWICVYCMAIRNGLFLSTGLSVFLYLVGFGCLSIVFFVLTMAFSSLFLKL